MPPPTNIIIIGSGIVGSALAHHLSLHPHLSIHVLSPATFHDTSTSVAPGLVGQYNELSALTTLAKDSVRAYKSLPPDAFSPVGGLEIASSPSGIATLEKRLELAHAAGLEAKLLSSAEAATLVPHLHAPDDVSRALYFPTDGVADAIKIAAEYQHQAREKGVTFLQDTLVAINQENGVVTGVTTTVTGTLPASHVIVASGIWTAELLKDVLHLPIIPVAHPYVHGLPRPARGNSSPFVRWPEAGVYARDHGAYDGFGAYDHAPIPLSGLASADAEWDVRLDGAVERALRVFPEATRIGMGVGERREGGRKVNGVFAVTPDGMPLAGRVPGVEGLWVVAAVWITHAEGTARVVADMVIGEEVDKGMKKALDPGRFGGKGWEELRKEALGTYNNIYNMSE